MSRSKENLGVAKIGPGSKVPAKMAFAADGKTVVMAENLELIWSQEYTGEGNGVLADRAKKEASKSGAITYTTGLTLGVASLLASLAF